jgi:hypothetical protein
MRLFYETWAVSFSESSAVADDSDYDSKIDSAMLLPIKSSAMADDLDINEFLGIGFSHHIEIISKTSSIDERVFYIHAYLKESEKFGSFFYASVRAVFCR